MSPRRASPARADRARRRLGHKRRWCDGWVEGRCAFGAVAGRDAGPGAGGFHCGASSACGGSAHGAAPPTPSMAGEGRRRSGAHLSFVARTRSVRSTPPNSAAFSRRVSPSAGRGRADGDRRRVPCALLARSWTRGPARVDHHVLRVGGRGATAGFPGSPRESAQIWERSHASEARLLRWWIVKEDVDICCLSACWTRASRVLRVTLSR